jgi:hypothetical protein
MCSSSSPFARVKRYRFSFTTYTHIGDAGCTTGKKKASHTEKKL